VKLVISDAHEGLRKLSGRRSRSELAALPCALHAGPARDDPAHGAGARSGDRTNDLRAADRASAMAQLHRVVDGIRTRFPQAAALLEEAAEDIWLTVPSPRTPAPAAQHEPLERLNKEIKRARPWSGSSRTGPPSYVSWSGAGEQDDEWSVADRRYFSASR